MTHLHHFITFSFLVSCGGTTPSANTNPTTVATTETGVTTSTTTTTTTETTDPGTDEDMDGWSVENGDCDDNNVWVNPGWPEDITDDIDKREPTEQQQPLGSPAPLEQSSYDSVHDLAGPRAVSGCARVCAGVAAGHRRRPC